MRPVSVLALALLVLAFSWTSPGRADPWVAPPGFASALKSADQAFKERRTEARAREALRRYRALVASSQRKNPQALWRLSMGCYFVGLRLTSSSSAKKKIFAEGRDAGLDALKLSPHCAACSFWTAVNMALYGQSAGVFKTIFTLDEIQELLKRSIEDDPTYMYSGAYRLLGTIEEKLPGVLGGSDEKARQYFEKAIAISPDEPLNFLFLSELLRKQDKTRELARAAAKRGASIRHIAPERLESLEARSALRLWLARGAR